MTNFKEKAQIFIIGLSIGLLVAGAFFILKLDDYFKELNLLKRVSHTFTSPEKKSEQIEPLRQEKPTRKKKEQTENSDKTSQDTLLIIDPDLTNMSDTIKRDSVQSALLAEDDIVVKQDKLLSTRTIEVFNMSPSAKLNSKDSLLQKVSGIKDDKQTGKQMFNVELWSSPLNYKGYKMSKYKIVLYGITAMDAVKLYKLDDVIYLKLSSAVYRLDYISDFKSYDRVTDEQIITKLK
ncbi:MAG: hypothetical protein K0S44_1324 [Bacteroidetes bacterium]|jgi:hypothetical protein|nr:hypothetical protein [Bacteroidota bacterium]